MKLLFKYKPKIILKELFKREFPMDAVLQLCNEYQEEYKNKNFINKVKAYILARTGSMKEALDI